MLWLRYVARKGLRATNAGACVDDSKRPHMLYVHHRMRVLWRHTSPNITLASVQYWPVLASARCPIVPQVSNRTTACLWTPSSRHCTFAVAALMPYHMLNKTCAGQAHHSPSLKATPRCTDLILANASPTGVPFTSRTTGRLRPQLKAAGGTGQRWQGSSTPTAPAATAHQSSSTDCSLPLSHSLRLPAFFSLGAAPLLLPLSCCPGCCCDGASAALLTS